MEYSITEEQKSILEEYKNMVIYWQKKVNLVSNNDLKHLQKRHIEDSLQLLSFLDASGNLLDIGSGGGFPSIVLAICSKNNITCVDSNNKKVFVLREIIKNLNLSNVRVINSKVEELKFKAEFDYVTSRAFGSLDNLITLGLKFLKKGGKAIFPRGSGFLPLIENTEEFVINIKQSITDKESKIIVLTKNMEV